MPRVTRVGLKKSKLVRIFYPLAVAMAVTSIQSTGLTFEDNPSRQQRVAQPAKDGLETWREKFDQAASLLDSEADGDRDKAREEFLKFPQDIVKSEISLRLKSPGAGVRAAKVALFLRRKDTIPDIIQFLKMNDNWQVLISLNGLAQGTKYQGQLDEMYLRQLRGPRGKSASALAILMGLRKPTPASYYDASLKGDWLALQKEVFAHFVRTRGQLSRVERRRRFALALASSEARLRSAAFSTLQDIPVAERKELKSLFDERACQQESHVALQKICLKIGKEVN